MSHTDDPISTTLPRRELGRALREAREGAGYTLEHAAALMEMGKASLGRLERGELAKVKTLYLEALCKLYGIEDRLGELKAIASEFGSKLWWHSTTSAWKRVPRNCRSCKCGIWQI